MTLLLVFGMLRAPTRLCFCGDYMESLNALCGEIWSVINSDGKKIPIIFSQAHQRKELWPQETGQHCRTLSKVIMGSVVCFRNLTPQERGSGLEKCEKPGAMGSCAGEKGWELQLGWINPEREILFIFHEVLNHITTFETPFKIKMSEYCKNTEGSMANSIFLICVDWIEERVRWSHDSIGRESYSWKSRHSV
jgi:hypothetical protein